MKIAHGRVKGDKPRSTFGVKKPFKSKARNRKGSKIKTVRIKPKAIKEPNYTKWVHKVYQPPCFVCGGFMGIEFHHIKENSSSERIDAIGMPLCWEHHHGGVLSPHGTPVKFREKYPMSVQLESAAKMYSKYKKEIL